MRPIRRDSTSISWLGRPETPFILLREVNKSAPGPAVSERHPARHLRLVVDIQGRVGSAEPRQATHVGVSEQPQLGCCSQTPPETPPTARATQTLQVRHDVKKRRCQRRDRWPCDNYFTFKSTGFLLGEENCRPPGTCSTTRTPIRIVAAKFKRPAVRFPNIVLGLQRHGEHPGGSKRHVRFERVQPTPI